MSATVGTGTVGTGTAGAAPVAAPVNEARRDRHWMCDAICKLLGVSRGDLMNHPIALALQEL